VGQDMVIATAEAIVTMAEMPKTSSESLRNFRGLAENWPELSDARLAEGRIGEAFVLAAACVAVMPKSAEARRVERDIVLHLRSQLRDAQARGDHAAVIALGRASGHVLYRRPEIATVYVRSLLTAGHVAEALLVARQACETFPEDIDLRGLCALVAASSGEMVLALQLYGELLAHPDPVAQRYHERADRYIERAGRTGVRHVRELVEAGDFTRAVDLCFLLREYPDAKERIAGELLKVRRALRLRLRELDDEEMTGDEPLRILKLMLRIMPEEPSTLRRAALEAMKWQDFDAALGYWRELNRVSPGVESTLKNINRCQIQVQRQAARTQPALPAIAA